METIEQFTSIEALNNFAHELRVNGFQLIIKRPKEDEKKPSWLHFAKNNKIGYVQADRYEKASFSTVHKPCRECGTGFRVDATGGDWAELTIENAMRALVHSPSWALAADRAAVRKYENAHDYAERRNKQWAPLNDVYEVIEPLNTESHAN